jgi:hypothetical protein
MQGQKILLSTDPKGRFSEVIISGTPKPGTFLEMTTAALVGGRETMQAVSRTTGTKGPVCILLEDNQQGKSVSDAYVSGTRAPVYWPLAGDEMNALVADVAGTAQFNATVGQSYVIQNTGKLVANSSNNAVPFQSLEAVTDPQTDYLLMVRFNGDQA